MRPATCRRRFPLDSKPSKTLTHSEEGGCPSPTKPAPAPATPVAPISESCDVESFTKNFAIWCRTFIFSRTLAPKQPSYPCPSARCRREVIQQVSYVHVIFLRLTLERDKRIWSPKWAFCLCRENPQKRHNPPHTEATEEKPPLQGDYDTLPEAGHTPCAPTLPVRLPKKRATTPS